MELPCLEVAAVVGELGDVVKMTGNFCVGGGHGED